MDLADFDYDLPSELIAQTPLADRAAARLLVLDREGQPGEVEAGAPPRLEHRRFSDIVKLIAPGSVLVLNETRVIPARLRARRASGGKVEVLLLEPRPDGDWEALVQAGGSLRKEEVVSLEDAGGHDTGATVTIVGRLGGGRWRVRFAQPDDAIALAERVGSMPLPPYIKRPAQAADRDDYQTVFARVPGAVAAPTAGLHFTPAILDALGARGVHVARVVLHVGLGTFAPVRVEKLEDHVMHVERYAVPDVARGQVEAARARGKPVIACGTTAARALESWAATGRSHGETNLFIKPGHAWRAVDQLITNFHVPKSTLLVLVSALAGRERILAAYREAIAQRYRFFSYGDAMLIR